MVQIKTIAVIGAGTMGNGIAHVFAQNNFVVNMVDVSQPQLDTALVSITKNLDRQLSKAAITGETKKNTISNLHTFTSLAEGIKEAELIIEAATENLELKLSIFKQIDEAAAAGAILATNTSSISITK